MRPASHSSYLWVYYTSAAFLFGGAVIRSPLAIEDGQVLLRALFEAAAFIQCQKNGPFPLIMMGARFWGGLRRCGQAMMREPVCTRDEIGFACITDCSAEAVDPIVRALPPEVRERLTQCRPPPSLAVRAASGS